MTVLTSRVLQLLSSERSVSECMRPTITSSCARYVSLGAVALCLGLQRSHLDGIAGQPYPDCTVLQVFPAKMVTPCTAKAADAAQAP